MKKIMNKIKEIGVKFLIGMVGTVVIIQAFTIKAQACSTIFSEAPVPSAFKE